MKEIIDYAIRQDHSYPQLAKDIQNKDIPDGWRPYGPVQVVCSPAGLYTYTQTLVAYKK